MSKHWESDWLLVAFIIYITSQTGQCGILYLGQVVYYIPATLATYTSNC